MPRPDQEHAEFLFTSEERAFRADLRGWLMDHPPPKVARTGLQEDVLPVQMSWERRLHDAGYGGMHWPKEFGGQARSLTFQLILAEELARAGVMPFRHRPTIVGLHMAGPFIIACGSTEQRDRYLSRILHLEDLWCQLFSEPDAGSDLASLRTSARKEGSTFVVNGQKIWNSYAHLADMGILLARTSTHSSKHHGLTCFLVDMHTEGITTRPLRQINGGLEFNEVFFDDVRIPESAVIGGVDKGWRAIMGFLAQERSALQLGSYAEMLLEAEELLAQVQHCGDAHTMDAAIDAFGRLVIQRWGALRLASQVERGSPNAATGSIGKLQWASNLQRLAAARTRHAGPRASAWPTGDQASPIVVHSLLSSLSASIAGGTSEIQRNLIAERVLGLPK